MEELIGYKAFNKNHTNRYGLLFEEGKTYTSKDKIKYGNNSTGGYHMCKRLEDTLRYFDSNDIVIASVIGRGKIAEYEDNYYGYYDMYSVEEITVTHFLSRLEVLAQFLKDNVDENRICRFIQSYNLNPVELKLFKYKYRGNYKINNYLTYYQHDKKQVSSKVKKR